MEIFVKIPICTFFSKILKKSFSACNDRFSSFCRKTHRYIFDTFWRFLSNTMGEGGVTLDYGENGWKKWNFDLSTIVKMNEKIQKKNHFSSSIMSIWKKVLIISVVLWNQIFWKQKFKILHMGILNIIFWQILEK